jgi:hypothetical protein
MTDNLQRAYEQKLRESGLDLADAQRLQFRLCGTTDCPAKLSYKGQGFVIPYLGSDGKPTRMWRYRYLEELWIHTSHGKRLRRYSQPAGVPPEAYMPPWPQDGPPFVLFTEGELKTICAVKHGYNCIGLGGIYNFQYGGCKFLPELAARTWKDVQVYIVYDSDAAANWQVCQAENRLAAELLDRGALVFIVRLPALTPGQKAGLDDYLVARKKEDFDQLLADTKPWARSRALHELNEEVCYVKDPSVVVNLHDRQVMNVRTFADERYVNRKWLDEVTRVINGRTHVSTVEKRAAKEWMRWTDRSTVHKMTYAPGQPVITASGELNRWQHSGITPKRGNVKPWHRLTDFLLASLSLQERQWFHSWVALPLQRPGTKIYGVVHLWSYLQGTGKTLAGVTIGLLYGKQNYHVIGNEELKSDFNSDWTENRQFIVGDEISTREQDKKAVYTRLKAWFTQDQVRIRTKFLPTYSMPDCLNYLFTSNEPDCFYVAPEDRRFFTVEVKGAPLPKKFYEDFVDWRDNQGGLAALLWYYTEEFKIPADFSATSPPPLTTAKERVIELGQNAAEKWVQDVKADPDEMLQSKKAPGAPSDPKHTLYSSRELTAFARSHIEGNFDHLEIMVGKALDRSGFEKVRCSKNGQIKIAGYGRPCLWIMRDAEKWRRVTDPAAIQAEYLRQRPPLPQSKVLKETR